MAYRKRYTLSAFGSKSEMTDSAFPQEVNGIMKLYMPGLLWGTWVERHI